MVRCEGFATLPEAKLQLAIITSIENKKPSLCRWTVFLTYTFFSEKPSLITKCTTQKNTSEISLIIPARFTPQSRGFLAS